MSLLYAGANGICACHHSVCVHMASLAERGLWGGSAGQPSSPSQTLVTRAPLHPVVQVGAGSGNPWQTAPAPRLMGWWRYCWSLQPNLTLGGDRL